MEEFEPATARKLTTDVRDINKHFASPIRKYFTLIYNTNLVQPNEVPASLSELLVEKWRGKITFTQPSGIETVDEAIAILLANDAINIDTLKKLADYVPQKDRNI